MISSIFITINEFQFVRPENDHMVEELFENITNGIKTSTNPSFPFEGGDEIQLVLVTDSTVKASLTEEQSILY